MRAFIKPTLVTHDLARVEGRAAPGGGFGGVAVEAAAAEVLGFFGGCVVCVLDGETGVRGEVGHGHGVAVGGRGVVEGTAGTACSLCWAGATSAGLLLGGDHERGRSVFEFDGGGVVEIVVGLVRRV